MGDLDFTLILSFSVRNKHQLSSLPQTRGRRKEEGPQRTRLACARQLCFRQFAVLSSSLLVDGPFTLEEKIDIRLWVLLEFQFCFSRFSLLFLLLLLFQKKRILLHSFIKK